MYYALPNPKKIFSKSSQPPNSNRTEAHPTPKLASIVSSTPTNHLTLTPRKYSDLLESASKVSLDFVKLKRGSLLQKRAPHSKGVPLSGSGTL